MRKKIFIRMLFVAAFVALGSSNLMSAPGDITGNLLGDSVICVNESVSLTADYVGDNPLNFEFSVDGLLAQASSSVNTFYLPSINNGQKIKVQVDDFIAGTQLIKEVTFVVNDLPVFSPTANVYGCIPNPVSIVQTPDLGYVFQYYQSDQSTVVATPNAVTVAGTYFITKTNTSTGCTSAFMPVAVSFNPNPATFAVTNPDAVCAPSTVSIEQPEEVAYTFKYYLSNQVTPVANPSAVSASGTYYITRKDDVTGCESDFVPIVVTINPRPTITPVSPAPVCPPTTSVNITQAPQAGFTLSYYEADKIALVSNPLSVTTSGTYYVTKTNTATGCVSNFMPISVSINTKPTFTPTSPPLACTPNTVSIVQNPEADFSFYYYLNDLTTEVIDPENISVPGTYYITKRNNITTCVSDHKSVNVQIITSPVAFAGDDRAVCENATTVLGQTGLSTVNYSWSPALHLSNPAVANPTATIVEDITYTLTASLKAYPQCKSTDDVSITASISPEQFSISGGGAYCPGHAPNGTYVELSNTLTNVDYALFKDGAQLTTWKPGNTGSPMLWENLYKGEYTVKGRNPNGCIQNMLGAVNIIEYTNPTAQFTSSKYKICPGDSVILKVRFFGSAPFQAVYEDQYGFSHHISSTDSVYQFTIKPVVGDVWTINSVTDTRCQNIYPIVSRPTVNITVGVDFIPGIVTPSNITRICRGDFINISAVHIDSTLIYKWSTGQTTNSITVSPTDTSMYYLEIKDSIGCFRKDSIRITVDSLPVVGFTGMESVDPDVCINDSPIQLVGTPPGGVFTGPNVVGSTYYPNANMPQGLDSVTYTYTDANGCTSDTTQYYYVNPDPDVDWYVPEELGPPTPYKIEYVFCRRPNDSLAVQGIPRSSDGVWTLYKDDSSPAVVVSLGDGLAYIKDCLPGTYHLRYTYMDNKGCENSLMKRIIILADYPDNLDLGEIIMPDTLCARDTLVLIKSTRTDGWFEVNNPAIIVAQDSLAGELWVNPSLVNSGKYRVMFFKNDGQMCEHYSFKDFYIQSPINIPPLTIPNKYCVTDPRAYFDFISPLPVSGFVYIIKNGSDTIVNHVPNTTSLFFDPAWGVGNYVIRYVYSDKYCNSVYNFPIVVNPLPIINMNQTKRDFCYGDIVTFNALPTGGVYSSSNANVGLTNNVFNTKQSGTGTFNIYYTYTSILGCVNTDSVEIYVRGQEDGDMKILNLASQYCENKGTVTIAGFPTADGVPYFSPAVYLTDLGNGQAVIDLSKTNYNSVNPVTFNFKEYYTDVYNNLDSCIHSVSQSFKIISKSADFFGYNHGDTICGIQDSLLLIGNETLNSRFTISVPVPAALENRPDGKAVLFPKELSQGWYTITYFIDYYEDGVYICSTQKSKDFYIIPIKPIVARVVCSGNNNAIQIDTTEIGVTYDLWVNGLLSESILGNGSTIVFSPVPTEAYLKIFSKRLTCKVEYPVTFHVFPLTVQTDKVDITCTGKNDGKITTIISGGFEPTSVLWSSGGGFSSTDINISNLSPETYTVTVTDSIGCARTSSQTLSDPTPITLTNLGQSTLLCNLSSEGYASVIASGGRPPYTYSWLDASNNIVSSVSSLSNVKAGFYRVYATDRNNCQTSMNVIIPESPAIHFEVTRLQEIVNFGSMNGEIDIDVTGGIAPYAYEWSGYGINPIHKNDKNQQNLIAGTYFLSITDAQGCKKDTFVVVTQPELLNVSAVVKDVACIGTSTGSVDITVAGGQPPYTYVWTDGASFSSNNQDIVGLPVGIYSVLITDAVGSTYIGNYKIDTPTSLSVFASGRTDTLLTCYNIPDGVLEVEANGGTFPYSFEWFGAGVQSSQKYNSMLTNLPIGVYRVVVTDANACSVFKDFEITQPTQIAVTESITTPICYGDKNAEIQILVSGGTPTYNFYWEGVDVVPTAQNQTNLAKGEYIVNVTDANGCKVKKTYQVSEPIKLTIDLSGSKHICEGGNAELYFTMNTTRNWTIDYTDGTSIFTINTSDAGAVRFHTPTVNTTYRLLQAYDENGCFAEILNPTISVQVHQYPDITLLKNQLEICVGEQVYLPYILSGESPWTVLFDDGTRLYEKSNILLGYDSLAVSPTSSTTLNLVSVSNEYCTRIKAESVDVIVHPQSTLTVSPISAVCEGQPTSVELTLTGESPWRVFYDEGSESKNVLISASPYSMTINPEQTAMFTFKKIVSDFGCEKSVFIQRSLIVYPLPDPAQIITGLSEVCAGNQARYFVPQIPFATSYQWTLPPGATIINGNGTNQILVQFASGAHSGVITVRGVNSCGIGEAATLNVLVNELAGDAGEIIMPDTLCQSQNFFYISVPFINNVTQYEWILPYGFTIHEGVGTENILVSLTKDAVSGTVRVVGKNLCSEGAASEKQVVVMSFPVIEAGPDSYTNCKDYIQMNATSPTPYIGTWKVIKGKGTFDNKNNPKTMVTDLGLGDNVFVWEVSNNFCTKTDTVTIMNDSPDLALPEIVDDYIFCADTITLRAVEPQFGIGRWDLVGGAGTIVNPNSNITKVMDLGYGKNVFRWTVSNGVCENFALVNIFSNSPKLYSYAGKNDTVYVSDYKLNAVKPPVGLTGKWTVIAGTGQIADENSYASWVHNLSHGINTFRWTLKDNSGCEAFSEVSIRYVLEPIANFASDSEIGCAPFKPNITNNTIGQADFLWDFGDGTTSTEFNPVHVFVNPGRYTVKLTATSDEKTSTYSQVITAAEGPIAKFHILQDTLFIPNAQLRILDESYLGSKYKWYFGDGTSSTDKNPTHRYLNEGWYDISLKVTSANSCVDSIMVYNAVLVRSEGFITFPNAFVPNKDYSNGGVYSLTQRNLDVFYPIWGDVLEYKLQIYNRWGEEVFVTEDINKGWDGYLNGKLCPMGVYVYKSSGKFKNGKTFNNTGEVTLIQ